MNSYVMRILLLIAAAPTVASAQTNAIASTGELPLLLCIGGGALAGGVLSLLKTRRRR
jgi:uncharacterized integral membrane protein